MNHTTMALYSLFNCVGTSLVFYCFLKIRDASNDDERWYKAVCNSNLEKARLNQKIYELQRKNEALEQEGQMLKEENERLEMRVEKLRISFETRENADFAPGVHINDIPSD